MNRRLKRRLLPVCLILLASLMAGVGCSKPRTPRGGEYYNKKEHFSVIPPAGWEQQEGFMGTVVIFRSPVTHANDDFRENVNVVSAKIPRNTGLTEFVTASVTDMKTELTDFQQLDTSSRTVNGKDTQRFICLYRTGQLDLNILMYLFVDNGRGYVVTCTAPPETFDEYLPTFEETCQSFMTD